MCVCVRVCVVTQARKRVRACMRVRAGACVYVRVSPGSRPGGRAGVRACVFVCGCSCVL
jgi:hypothetical protein